LVFFRSVAAVTSASSPIDFSSEFSSHHPIDKNGNDDNTDTMPSVNATPQQSPLTRVCLIGSGNWGSAMATLIGRNCARLPFCETTVRMWVHEEDVELPDGRVDKLTHVINSQHENVKYLPGMALPPNVVAVADLAEACQGATLLIFVLPHQFLPRLLPTIRARMGPGCRGVSLIKGLGRWWWSQGVCWDVDHTSFVHGFSHTTVTSCHTFPNEHNTNTRTHTRRL
jgi:hypothetical protein